VKLKNVKVEILLQWKINKRKSLFIRILKAADSFGDASPCMKIKDKMALW
jgi:hypothetical protein